jgi:5-methyltetrahydropteroyltriglutamate--homocysteine methyltransferase
MLSVTQDLMLPTAITGSYPRPLWFNESLRGRSFKSALGDSIFREQYLDAVACVINAQEAAGLDIVTDGDSRFDLAVGGKSWFFYPIERLGGIDGHRDTSRGWMQRHDLRPGRILWEVQEAYQPGVVRRADAGTARVHGALEGGPALDGQAREVRHDLRARAGEHALERVLPRRQGAHLRPV